MRPVDDTITVAELDRDPYPIYARLRREAPVCFVPAVGAWLVTRWAEATAVAADPETFGAASDSPLRRALGENVLTVHGDAHRRLRRAMEPPLTRARVAAYAPALVDGIARELFEPLKPRGQAELMSEFLEPVSVLSLASVLGLPPELGADTLRRWFAELAAGGSNYEHDPAKDALAARAAAEIEAAVDVTTAGGLIGTMRDAGLDRDELLANLKLFLLGGMQEPGHAAGNAVYALLTHPEQAFTPEAAMEEGLRWLGPVGTATREVLRPTALGGVELNPGERVAVVLTSANRDEARFQSAEAFDLARHERKHRAFGIGAHFCVGHWLAREEIRTPLRMLFTELPELRLDPENPPLITGWEFRGPAKLPVLWTTGSSSTA